MAIAPQRMPAIGLYNTSLILKYWKMEKIISLEFKYRSRIYYALIRTKEDGESRLHSITVMNGELERLLYGNHIIMEKEGCFQSALPLVDKQIGELKQCIINALCRYMQEAPCPQPNGS